MEVSWLERLDGMDKGNRLFRLGATILIAALLFCSTTSAAAFRLKPLAPMVFVGAQNVAPVTGYEKDFAATVLALWSLPKRSSFQIQYIVPTHASGRPLLRLAVDIRIF